MTGCSFRDKQFVSHKTPTYKLHLYGTVSGYST